MAPPSSLPPKVTRRTDISETKTHEPSISAINLGDYTGKSHTYDFI